MATTNARGNRVTAGLGIIAVSALIMSGCGSSDDEAEFADATETASDLKPVDADLLTVPQEADLGKVVSTDATNAGDEGNIVVPSGELKVTGISTVEQVPQSVIDNGVAPEAAAPTDDEGLPEETSEPESSEDADSGEALGAADGKKLSLVTVDYTSIDSDQGPGLGSEDNPVDTADLASPTLTLDLDGQSRELPKLDEDGQRTYLMSIPAEGKAEFVVTQDGHEQRLDLNTGKRLNDEVAATYYREKTEPIEVNEPMAFPDITAGVGRSGSSNSYDYKVKLSTELAEARLTPWTKENGWAEDGAAWLVIDGKAGIEPEALLSPSSAKITYSLAADGEKEADFEVAADGYSKKFNETLSVPVGTEKIEITGSAKVNLKASGQDVKGENPRTVKTKQPYEIDFGAANSSTSGQSEETSSPGPTESTDAVETDEADESLESDESEN